MLSSIALALSVISSAANPVPLTTIAFGSCADQDKPQPIWDVILAQRPQVFVFLGDNIYASDRARNENPAAEYAKLSQIPGFQRLKQGTEILAIWDDHDFGVNDGGREFERKHIFEKAFLDFFEVPLDHPRRQRPGIYDAVTYGPAGKRVQFILLDTRYFRSPLTTKPEGSDLPGRYIPSNDPNQEMLGEAQWQWLEEQLREPAEVRIIASSVQVVAQDNGWELWNNLPLERARLFETINRTNAEGVVFLSGDRHLAEISMMDAGVGYPIFDVTASALTNSRGAFRYHEPNRHRVGTLNVMDNFGQILIDWNREDPLLKLQIIDVEGDVRVQQSVPLSWLRRAETNSVRLAG